MQIKNYPQNFGKAKVMEFNKYKNFAARNFYYLAKECAKNRKSAAVAGLHRIFFNKPGTCCFYFTGIGEETRLTQHFSDYLFQKKKLRTGYEALKIMLPVLLFFVLSGLPVNQTPHQRIPETI